jgi:3-hydroxyacyl-CoA dehydrogenase/enoyl-CoA hydratase/carnithine racemase
LGAKISSAVLVASVSRICARPDPPENRSADRLFATFKTFAMDVAVVRLVDDGEDGSVGALGTLTYTTRMRLVKELREAFLNDMVGIVVLTGGPRWFSAGADIKELAASSSSSSSRSISSSNSSSSSGRPMGMELARDFLLTFTTHNLAPIVELIDAAPKPVVAFMAGSAYGGGLELALACQYRICTEATRLQFPEVGLGIIPGALGTQLLPRLVPFDLALSMCVDSRRLTAREALAADLVDQIVGYSAEEQFVGPSSKEGFEHMLARVTAMLRVHLSAGAYAAHPFKRTSTQRPLTRSTEALELAYAKLAILPRVDNGGRARRGAVRALLAAVRADSDFVQGAVIEAKVQAFLIGSAEAMALRYYFLAERAAKKPPSGLRALKRLRGMPRSAGASSTIPLGGRDKEVLAPSPADMRAHGGSTGTGTGKAVVVTHVGVVGAGLMGAGIAVSLLRAGFSVALCDMSAAALTRARDTIESILTNGHKRGHNSKAEVNTMKKACTYSTVLSSLGACGVVVEAVFESLSVKIDLLSKLCTVVSPQCILCTNTSSLDVEAMAQSLPRARRPHFLGWHFFSPAHRMSVVEVVRHSDTALSTVATVMQISHAARKIPILCENCPGFIGNRMVFPYILESMLLLEDGATVSEVDGVCRDFGLVMGPFQMNDMSGLDVGFSIRQERGLVDSFTAQRYSSVGDELYRMKRLGVKSGKGFYTYTTDKKSGRPVTVVPAGGAGQDTEVDSAVQASRLAKAAAGAKDGRGMPLPAEHGPARTAAILRRIILPLINEGFKLLGEGTVVSDRPGDVDVLYVQGYGWPVWRGGPLLYAQQMGLRTVLGFLEELHTAFPTSLCFLPAPLLRRMVAYGVGVYDLQADPDLVGTLMGGEEEGVGGKHTIAPSRL